MIEVNWYTLLADSSMLIAELIAPGVTRLSERVLALEDRSFFYLLEGDERDCVIDGGWGFCRSLDTVRSRPEKPLIAVATHSHFDHIGLLHLARERFGHAAEEDVFRDPDPVATQALPFLVGRPVLQGGRSIRPDSIRQEPCPLDHCVGDGDTLDLGGRVLRFMHAPGHSPGSLAVLDNAHGLLFCADTVHDGHIYDDIPGADRGDLVASHRRLAEVDFLKACPGHGAIMSRPDFLDITERYRWRVSV
jgi:glyoxylase-like metal-dependent hydrolase (beta-lactamase superfamily II)